MASTKLFKEPTTTYTQMEATVRLIYNVHNRNDNNFSETAPFTYQEGTLSMDMTLWAKIQNTWLGRQLEAHYGLVRAVEGPVVYGPPDDEFYKIYWYFHHWTSAEKWWFLIPESQVVPLPVVEQMALLALSARLKGEDVTAEDLCEIPLITAALTIALHQCCSAEHGAFIKTEHCSTKKDYRPVEVYTVTDALTHILKSSACVQLLTHMDTDHYLLLSPWQDMVSRHNEFRVFVQDQKVMGISQQCVYAVSQIMLSVWRFQPEAIYQAVEKLCVSIFAQLPADCRYDECCLDVWLTEVEGDISAHLIEINARGGWGPAGSALYSWQRDPPNHQREVLLLAT